MKGQELKDFVKSNHKDFGGSMSNKDIVDMNGGTSARISQIKAEIKDAIKKAAQDIGQSQEIAEKIVLEVVASEDAVSEVG